MDGSGLNHISLVQGLSDNYIRRRASKGAENWKTMANAFDSIAKMAGTAGETKAYNEPRYEKPTDIHVISNSFDNSQEVLLIGTGALIEVTMSTVGTTARTIHIRLQGTIHPGRTAKNHCVTTVQAPIISQNPHNTKKVKVSINMQHNR